jgi:signal transduction histidine kinase
MHIFSFSDDGVGINEEDAEKHQGEVWMRSREKKGITFYISISKALQPINSSCHKHGKT